MEKNIGIIPLLLEGGQVRKDSPEKKPKKLGGYIGRNVVAIITKITMVV